MGLDAVVERPLAAPVARLERDQAQALTRGSELPEVVAGPASDRLGRDVPAWLPRADARPATVREPAVPQCDHLHAVRAAARPHLAVRIGWPAPLVARGAGAAVLQGRHP
jgi:hypothetical protein